MEIAYYIIIFIFGTIIGSFLNVVIYRYNTGTSIAKGRSMCFSCGKTLAWYELVPVLSFVVQRGKCSGCGSKISWQYPLVEIITGSLFLLTLFTLMSSGQINIFSITFLLTIMSIFVVISVYDIRHKIIPEGLVYGFILLSFIQLFFIPNVGIIDWLAGPIFFLPFAMLWFFSKGQWMGFGDAKIALGIGWFLGFYGGLSAIILAFWIGAVYGIILIGIGKLGGFLSITKKFTIKSEIPFGPFLIIGTLLVLFFNIEVLSLVQLLRI